ncbi:DUF547 domain-containing protein [Aureisphaera galaxeae]|uniref:DUF547 domain-containing protein n=1 Tax=Aureisphaera galaxeae TaxID=1538023 RepID=UPI00235038B3|nr:DUF547 domain-containing protein [Aureisphaera galaxeae]MDC8002508.1 DUF547 domain-containing protein [Aureisphaera galaxeae]
MKRFLFLLALVVCSSTFSQTIDLTEYDKFLKDHVSNKGVVNYDKVLKNMEQLNKITSNFSKISPNASWTPSELKSYWINFYNANVIKLLAENYPIKSINYIRDAFKIDIVKYDGIEISLDMIEHEVIRKLNDPRVHFALYSTAISSPKLKRTAYQPETIEYDLGVATSNFINDKTKNIITTRYAKLSKIFEWYKDDFNLINFINRHSSGDKLIKSTKITYMEYNWNLHRK